jgi:hypothetical protein
LSTTNDRRDTLSQVGGRNRFESEQVAAAMEEIRSLSLVRDSNPSPVLLQIDRMIGGPITTGYQTAPRGGAESSRSI